MIRTIFCLPAELVARLKAAKLKSGASVSEIMRRAADAYLKSIGL